MFQVTPQSQYICVAQVSGWPSSKMYASVITFSQRLISRSASLSRAIEIQKELEIICTWMEQLGCTENSMLIKYVCNCRIGTAHGMVCVVDCWCRKNMADRDESNMKTQNSIAVDCCKQWELKSGRGYCFQQLLLLVWSELWSLRRQRIQTMVCYTVLSCSIMQTIPTWNLWSKRVVTSSIGTL